VWLSTVILAVPPCSGCNGLMLKEVMVNEMKDRPAEPKSERGGSYEVFNIRCPILGNLDPNLPS
jgi:hypothetical protein